MLPATNRTVAFPEWIKGWNRLPDFTLNIFHNNTSRFFAVSFHITFKLYISGIRYYLYKTLYVFCIMERICRSAYDETWDVDVNYTIPYFVVSNSKRVSFQFVWICAVQGIFIFFNLFSAVFFIQPEVSKIPFYYRLYGKVEWRMQCRNYCSQYFGESELGIWTDQYRG